MSIHTGTILNTLYSCSKVFISFESLTSDGKIHEGHYTLKGKRIKRQSNDTDTLVAWNVDKDSWEDIRVSTITYFIGIPDESKN